MTDVRLDRRRILIDGVPALIAAGEVHYFRLARPEWRRRLELLREAGADTVASYAPWVVHERGNGSIDVTGRTDPTLDVAAFLDLATELGLRAILRPGPFVMAEMAGEGVPDRVRRQHPEVVPLGWGGVPTLSADLDYLAPAFLAETQRWYHALGSVVAPRMAPVGGPVIALQLDNEIGMLAWVSNTPQLTDRSCLDLLNWLDEHHGAALGGRYPGLPTHDAAAFATAIRNPEPGWGRALRLDLGRFFRGQFGRYVDHLAEFAGEAGMGGVPFLVNIHGSSGGSGASFPIGISQLSQAYPGRAQLAAGSDHYLGDLNLRMTADLHLINAYLAAVNDADQPLTTLEFEAGTADYGDDLWNEVDPSAVVLKTRLSLAQGHRLLNYYLFAGGTNFVADPPRTDGTTRFGITGERHGFGAPVTPEGEPGRGYRPVVEAVAACRRLAPWLADASEEHDDLALAMVLDDYLTEYRPPSDSSPEAVDDLVYARGAGPRDLLGRVLLTLGYRYGAVDLQRDGALPSVLVLGSPSAAERSVQERLAAHVEGGGGLVLLGEVPITELDGTPCTVLADALGLRVAGEVRDRPHYFPSVRAAWGWGTERRVGRIQLLDAPGAEVVLTEAMSGRACGVVAWHGAGTAVVVTCDFGADLAFWRTALERAGARPGLGLEPFPGLIGTTTRAGDGSRLLHLINVSGHPASTPVTLDGEPLFDDERLTVPARSGLALPIGVHVGGHLLTATAEIATVGADAVQFTGSARAWLDGIEVDVDNGHRIALNPS